MGELSRPRSDLVQPSVFACEVSINAGENERPAKVTLTLGVSNALRLAVLIPDDLVPPPTTEGLAGLRGGPGDTVTGALRTWSVRRTGVYNSASGHRVCEPSICPLL